MILSLAPTLVATRNMNIYLRDITQAYVQSNSKLNKLILANLPASERHKHPPNMVMKILKPLYGIAEAGTHWYATYHSHHLNNLNMETSIYDPCFLLTKKQKLEQVEIDGPFGLVGMQVDDSLMLCNHQFAKMEDEKLSKAQLRAKKKELLEVNFSMSFNGCRIILHDNRQIQLRQKPEQGAKLALVTNNDEYRQQRARGAYISSTCQPEAAFDLSTAAQHPNPNNDDILKLNKSLQWQIDHIDRGINYDIIELASAKLFVFVDASFANFKDMSSQIGYVIILGNETKGNDDFKLHGNLVHFSSTKSKRVTHSVLASEVYGMVFGVDMSICISTTPNMIMDRLELPHIPVVVCTDSLSLYESLVKLNTTREKRLMISIMALGQSYENKKLAEVRWIRGTDNPADCMTESSSNSSLGSFINTNKLTAKVQGEVKR